MKKLAAILCAVLFTACEAPSGRNTEYVNGGGWQPKQPSGAQSQLRRIGGFTYKRVADTPMGYVYEVEIDGRKYLIHGENGIILKDGCSCGCGK